MIGHILGHYRIEATLGEGGMGVVYKAADMHLDRPVALKILRADLSSDTDRKRRFQLEARAASALNHPNIVHVYDVGTDAGVDFIAMEFVEGQTLDRLIGNTGLKTNIVLDYAIQVADALAAAHAKGIVHRDIKPSNIIVNSSGQLKVLDFGIAKLVDPAEPNSNTTRIAPPQTEEGAVVGTAAYMSPEQAEGRPVGASSDIFSFGSTLFEMTTGRRAFAGDTTLAVMSAILHSEPPSLREVLPSVPEELDKIVSRCLRKDPGRRTRHMIDVKLDLEELKEQTGRKRAVSRPRNWRSAAILGVAALIGIPAIFLSQTRNADEHGEPLAAAPLTTLPGNERYPSLSPDGNSVAFMWAPPTQDHADIYLQLIGSGTPLRLTSSSRNEFNPVWSPDGKTIAFLRADRLPTDSAPPGRVELWLVPALGGTERKLVDLDILKVNSRPAFLAWCPQSDCLVATSSAGEQQPDALFLFSRETSERRQLTHPPTLMLGDNNPAVSPDGRWLAFRRAVASSSGQIHTVALTADMKAAGVLSSVTRDEADGAFPAWLPGSNAIVFSGDSYLWKVDVPAQGPPARLPFIGEGSVMPAIAGLQDGSSTRLVYVLNRTDSNVWRVDMPRPGSTGTQFEVSGMSSTLLDFLGDLSPDGKRVVFVSRRPGGSLWLSDIDGTNVMSMTGGPRQGFAPRWSPDGEMIAFHGSDSGNFEIYTVPAGGGRPRVIASHPAGDHVPSFSRDGQSIYFSSARTGRYEIWKVAIAGGEPTQITRDGGFLPLEGPDGRNLYYVRHPGAPAVFQLNLQTGESSGPLFSGVINGAFFVTDPGIYFLDFAAGRSRLQFYDFARRKTLPVLADLGGLPVGLLAASRDARVVLFGRIDAQINDLMLVDNFQ